MLTTGVGTVPFAEHTEAHNVEQHVGLLVEQTETATQYAAGTPRHTTLPLLALAAEGLQSIVLLAKIADIQKALTMIMTTISGLIRW